jgi:uncharacterized iron-regulated membrane protein
MYNTIWRWHFYAGLFCIPFVLLLSVTGAFYLFKPQVEGYLDRPYEELPMAGGRRSAAEQVSAALAAVPGSVLNSYELPATPRSAARVIVGRGSELYRVYVHPETLAVLRQEAEDGRLMRIFFRLHGELLLGDRGSMVVELAASWAIVMFLTGLYLWWPRNVRGLAGVAYPRLRQGGRVFWRDLHAVIGLWISFFVLFLLISGLPWAASWGGLLKELRQLGATVELRQDWTTGRSSELAERLRMNTQAEGMGEHAGHAGHSMAAAPPDPGRRYDALDRMVAAVQPLQLAPPVLISPPAKGSPDWTARSEAQNRTLRVNLTMDADTGAIKSRQDFAGRPLIDRLIGIGVAAHEGQLFGWPNQLLGLCTALGLLLMAASSVVLWWRRRVPGTLGAPRAGPARPRTPYWLVGTIAVLGVVLPLLGLSMIAVLIAERWVLRRISPVSRFLGLDDGGGAKGLA